MRKGIKDEKHPSDPHRVSFFINLPPEQRLVQHVIEEFFCQLQLLSAEALKPYLLDQDEREDRQPRQVLLE